MPSMSGLAEKGLLVGGLGSMLNNGMELRSMFLGRVLVRS